MRAQEPGTFSPGYHEQSTPLAGNNLLCKDRRFSYATNSTLADEKPSAKPLRLYENHGKRRRLFKAQHVLLSLTTIFLIWLRFVIPFKVPWLSWLAASRQHLHSCIYRNNYPPQVYNDALSPLNGTAPNITRE